MFAGNPFKEVREFDPRELHKKVGQLVWIDPTDSDLNEGYCVSQLWFRDDKNNLYLLIETRARGCEDEP